MRSDIDSALYQLINALYLHYAEYLRRELKRNQIYVALTRIVVELFKLQFNLFLRQENSVTRVI